MPESIVSVSLETLRTGDVSFSTLEDAFGPESLGIIIVKDVLPDFAVLRHRLLSYSSYLGNLPTVELEKLENSAAKYLTGWSCGKETLKSGHVDTLKGSYYANCAFYVNPVLECAIPTAQFSPTSFPEYLSPNIWPSDDMLPGFKQTFEDLCRIIIDTAVLVAQACDRYAENMIPDYKPGYLQHVVKTSTTTKARLLHYYPSDLQKMSDNENGDDWCATHLDHGTLTGLTSAMFIDENEHEPKFDIKDSLYQNYLPSLPELSASPDQMAGLYVRSRSGNTVQIKIPRDCIAFQTGEALERITKGRFKAVPHFVRGVRSGQGSVSRNTLAVFTQPNLGEIVDVEQGIKFGEFARGIVEKNTTM